MTQWVGVYRRSISAVPPWWQDHAEMFDSLTHAVNTFTRRQGGKRPVPPPRLVGWDLWGHPTIRPTTLPWLLPEADKTATLELVPFTPDTTLGTVTDLVQKRQVVVIRLDRRGHVLVTKPKE